MTVLTYAQLLETILLEKSPISRISTPHQMFPKITMSFNTVSSNCRQEFISLSVYQFIRMLLKASREAGNTALDLSKRQSLILQNPNRTHTWPPLAPVLSQINSVRNSPSFFSRIPFCIIAPKRR